MNKTIIKRQSKKKKLLLQFLSEIPIISISCKKSNVSRSTYYEWLQEDLEFAENADKAIVKGNLLINDLSETSIISLIKDKNLGASIFWLKHHNQTYSPRIEITAKNNYITEKELNNLTDLLYDQNKFKEGQKLLINYAATGRLDEKMAQLILKLFSSQMRIEDSLTRSMEANVMSEVMIRNLEKKEKNKFKYGPK